MNSFDFVVRDTPRPQGSKRHVGNGVMIEQSAGVKTWREAVKQAAVNRKDAIGADDGIVFVRGVPVELHVRFFHKRPANHYRTGRHSAELKPTAPTFVTVKPDIDKIIRSTADAIGSAGVWGDDCQIVRTNAEQVYSDTGFEGAEITIRVAT